MSAQRHLTRHSSPVFHSIVTWVEQPLKNDWTYTFNARDFYQLTSASQIMDLIQSLQNEKFLTVANVQNPSLFTQCLRLDNDFRTEAVMPHQLTAYGDSPQRLVVSMATCYQIMSHYVTTNGSAPAFESLYTFPIDTY